MKKIRAFQSKIHSLPLRSEPMLSVFRQRFVQNWRGARTLATRPGRTIGTHGPLAPSAGTSGSAYTNLVPHTAAEQLPGLRFQIWSFALTLFPAFDFVFPFSPFSLFRAVFPFPPGKRFSLNAFSNNFQKNAAFWENPEKFWLEFYQNSAKFWEILQNFVKISEIFSDF